MSSLIPHVQGVLEAALYVEDLDRAQDFYERVFGFREIFRESGRLHALSVADKQVLLLFLKGASTQPTDVPGGRLPPHDGHGKLHMAFAINGADVEPWLLRLRELNIAISSEVDFPDGGHSIYFRDPDDHLLELVTPGVWEIY